MAGCRFPQKSVKNRKSVLVKAKPLVITWLGVVLPGQSDVDADDSAYDEPAGGDEQRSGGEAGRASERAEEREHQARPDGSQRAAQNHGHGRDDNALHPPLCRERAHLALHAHPFAYRRSNLVEYFRDVAAGAEIGRAHV